MLVKLPGGDTVYPSAIKGTYISEPTGWVLRVATDSCNHAIKLESREDAELLSDLLVSLSDYACEDREAVAAKIAAIGKAASSPNIPD